MFNYNRQNVSIMKKYRVMVSIIVVFIALFANNCFAQRRVNNRGPKIKKPGAAAAEKDNTVTRPEKSCLVNNNNPAFS
jgi:hypothetical protein